MSSTNDLLIAGLWFLLAGFALGITACFLGWNLLCAQQRCVHRRLSCTGDLRRTVAALQQFQVLIGRDAAERDPSLADLVGLLHTVQREFGCHASLEAVIQALVGRDLAQQVAARRQRRARDEQQQRVVMT